MLLTACFSILACFSIIYPHNIPAEVKTADPAMLLYGGRLSGEAVMCGAEGHAEGIGTASGTEQFSKCSLLSSP